MVKREKGAVVSTVTTVHSAVIEEATESKVRSTSVAKACKWFFHWGDPWIILVRCKF